MAEYERMNKEEYKEAKQQERNEVYDMLSASTQSLMNRGELKTYLDLQAQFFNQSPSNVLLIKAQNPQASWVRSSEEWKQDEVFPRRGEKGIMTLESVYYQKLDGSLGRSFRVAKSFDISQTTAAGREIQMPNFKGVADHIADASPVRVEPSDVVAEGLDAIWDMDGNRICVRHGMSEEQEFYVTAREIACVELAGQGKTRDDVLPLAECTAYVLSKRYGYDVPVPNLDRIIETFPGKEEKDVRRMLSDVRQTAGLMDAKAIDARNKERTMDMER